jgi:hypothetical protein
LLEPPLFTRVQDQAVSVRVDASSTVSKDVRWTKEIGAIAGMK